MRKLVAIPIILLGAYLMGLPIPKLPDMPSFGGIHSPSDPINSPILGRWDQVPEWEPLHKQWLHENEHGYVRFNFDGAFRSEIHGKQLQGRFQLLSGGAIEFSVSYDVTDLRTKRKTVEKEVWEGKYILDGDIMKLCFKGSWITLRKAPDILRAPEIFD